jgi:serine/threonine protein phosphatase PrpC
MEKAQIKAAVISERGMRPTMEDAHVLDLNFAGRGWVFAGIYDGHSGKEAATYAAQRVHRLFQKSLLDAMPPAQAFIDSYETASREMGSLDSGTTAVDFLVREGEIYAANVGDARAIVIGAEHVRQLTTEHRLDDLAERERIESMGGYVRYPYTYRGTQGLMPTRSLGDEYFKPVGIIATPSVSEYRISDDDSMVLAACDGLFDFMENEEVARFARDSTGPEDLLEALKREVLFNRLGTDNLTIIAISLVPTSET